MSEEQKSEIDVGAMKKKRGRPAKIKVTKTKKRTAVVASCTADTLTILQSAKTSTGNSYSRLINMSVEYANDKGFFDKLDVKVPAAVAKAQKIIADYEKKQRDASH